MKKNITIITSLLILITVQNSLHAQNDKSTNCVKKGNFIFDAFYGYPYLFGQYVKQAINQNSVNDIAVTNFNHVGGKCEYMITDMIGLGLEYTYATVHAKYSETNSVYQNGIYVNQINNYTASITKQRILAKFNIHFATSKHLDPYATAGIGFKQSIVKSDNINDQQDVHDLNNSFLNIFPVSFRLGAGLRYYFIENLGVCVEAGIGGPIIQGGITGKF
jgi:opacity protein-like surface antigen